VGIIKYIHRNKKEEQYMVRSVGELYNSNPGKKNMQEQGRRLNKERNHGEQAPHEKIMEECIYYPREEAC
jgi:hypothetical protein